MLFRVVCVGGLMTLALPEALLVADRRGDRAQAEHWRQHAGVPPDSAG